MRNVLKATALQMFEDGVSKRAISIELGVPRSTVQDWVRNAGEADIGEVPLSESAIPKLHDGTRTEIIEDIRALALANPEKVIGRNYYRVHGTYAESAWSKFFGTWSEAKRQSGIVLTRQQHNLEKQIAKQASVDHYRKLSHELKSYGDKYTKPDNGERFKQVFVMSDLHDKNVDPFFLKVALDTCLRIQPDDIVINGDLFDAPHFGKYHTDVRDYGIVERMNFVQEEILGPLRKNCPNANLDVICGNHEERIVKHLADQTPALRVLLSDFHGMTVSSLLGLDRFGINFICKNDLSAYTLADSHKEIAKNFKIYYQTLLCHHFPEGANLGYSSITGHHHKTVVTPKYSHDRGTHYHVQNSGGHKLDAEYCHPKWSLGFTICTIDTQDKSCVMDVVTFSENMAVVGGKIYLRDENA